MTLELVFENALIHDGTGRVAYRADVGVQGEHIAAIGRLNHVEATRRIDASRAVLCPGFIDIHTHADMAMHRPDNPKYLEPLIRQGITTFVGGNCGVAMAPVSTRNRIFQMMFYDFFLGEDQEPLIHWNSFGDMLSVMEKQGMAMNAGVLAPHGIIRMDAMGDSTDRAGVPELRSMKALLSECMEAGAMGMSTGLQYFPGLASDTWELTELARIVHDHHGVFTSHLRSYSSNTIGKAIDEVVTVCRDAQVPVQISHLFWVPNFPGPLNKMAFTALKGLSAIYQHRRFPFPIESAVKPNLVHIQKLVDQGYPIGVDAMPTSAGFTHALAFFPPWSLQGGYNQIKKRLSTPSERAAIYDAIVNGQAVWPHRDGNTWSMNFLKLLGFSGTYIMSVKSDKNRDVIGKSINELGEYRKAKPFDALCDLLLEEDGRVLLFETATFPGDPFVELSVQGSLVDPNVAIVTDSILLGFGLPSHLFYDCYPKFLGEYVREKKLIGLGEAIRKSTSLPAKYMGLRNRGEVKVGNYADLVLFDPKTIRSKSTVSDPWHFPEGIKNVVINGHVVVDEKGYHPEPRPGKLIRRGDS